MATRNFFFPLFLAGCSTVFALRTPTFTYSVYATRVSAGLTVPDTSTINAFLPLGRAHASDLVYDYVVCSWLFGIIIASKLPSLKYADLKKTLADKRFKINGTIAARGFLQRES